MIPNLRLYALIADGERGALVGPSGEMTWLCMPSWDSESVFTTLLGGEGSYAITPLGRYVWGGYYELGSLIWRNRWTLADGSIVECRDALAFPGDPERALVLRRLSAPKGRAKVRVRLALRGSFGRQSPQDLRRTEQGEWTARIHGLHARWTGGEGADLHPENELTLEMEIVEGQKQDFLLELSTKGFSGSPPDPEEQWNFTKRSWELSAPRLDKCAGERDARHAWAVLRGLTTSTGGMVAAATTSLPERADSGRSYDYRYVWIRDQCWTGQAMAVVGSLDLLRDALRFVRNRLLEDGSDLRPVYTASGRKVPEERELEHLPGYPGSTRIVVGNRAGEQFQLDEFGETLLLFAAAARQDVLDTESRRAAEVAAAAIEQRWQEKGAGVWETKPRHWTYSRLVCAAGLRQMAEYGVSRQVAARWMALAEAITAEAAATAVHPSGRWQRSTDDERVDASLLLPVLRDAVEPHDPRSLATLQAIQEDLVRDGYCYRFRSSLPLNEGEGAFTVCGHWLALTHVKLKNMVEGARWFERSRAACGPPGLYSEEYDVIQRELRGNLPQAFVHALLLESAARLGRDLGEVKMKRIREYKSSD